MESTPRGANGSEPPAKETAGNKGPRIIAQKKRKQKQKSRPDPTITIASWLGVSHFSTGDLEISTSTLKQSKSRENPIEGIQLRR